MPHESKKLLRRYAPCNDRYGAEEAADLKISSIRKWLFTAAYSRILGVCQWEVRLHSWHPVPALKKSQGDSTICGPPGIFLVWKRALIPTFYCRAKETSVAGSPKATSEHSPCKACTYRGRLLTSALPRPVSDVEAYTNQRAGKRPKK